MEPRGGGAAKSPNGRPPIARRSCDQCRARKVACDRGSPCSNCSPARLHCTYSAVASRAAPAKQRVLISSQYERKLDDIAKGVDDIKLLLDRRPPPSDAPRVSQPVSPTIRPLTQPSSPPLTRPAPTDRQPELQHSSYVVDFVKNVVENGAPSDAGPDANEILSSLTNLATALEDTAIPHNNSISHSGIAHAPSKPVMPPSDAVVAVCRWAKDRESYFRISWIASLLPLQKFADICAGVYFAVEDYSQIDFILANGYLSHVFAEHVATSGQRDYREHGQLCQRNFADALARLPLLLPASMEVIAALMLATFWAIENSKASMAWTFLSTASSLCLTLGYHQDRRSPPATRALEDRLFWSVHRLDKGLALRLGRPSTIRDAEITLPRAPHEPRSQRVARIQGATYEQLYSPAALALPADARGRCADALAVQLRVVVDETLTELYLAADLPPSPAADPIRIAYLQCDLVCQLSLLSLILRAAPPAAPGATDGCVAAARDTLAAHHACVAGLRACAGDEDMVARYISWATQHLPFVPFSILFNRVIARRDADDLASIERFAASLQRRPSADGNDDGAGDAGSSGGGAVALYTLLCRAARLHVEAGGDDGVGGGGGGECEYTRLGLDLGSWYHANQRVMGLLDEDLLLF